MPLLMLDLDNTLIDRDAAFSEAVSGFLVEFDLPPADLAWVTAIDASGYTSRPDVATALADRYGTTLPDRAIRALLDHGAADRATLTEACHQALNAALVDGWTCVIVTNGRVTQQTAKIRKAGLDHIVHGWVISEEVGHKKPAPEIFHTAARIVDESLHGAWMIGDSPHADIAGAHELGLASVWVSAGRPWTHESFQPTYTTDDVASAINHVITAPRQK